MYWDENKKQWVGQRPGVLVGSRVLDFKELPADCVRGLYCQCVIVGKDGSEKKCGAEIALTSRNTKQRVGDPNLTVLCEKHWNRLQAKGLGYLQRMGEMAGV